MIHFIVESKKWIIITAVTKVDHHHRSLVFTLLGTFLSVLLLLTSEAQRSGCDLKDAECFG